MSDLQWLASSLYTCLLQEMDILESVELQVMATSTFGEIFEN